MHACGCCGCSSSFSVSKAWACRSKAWKMWPVRMCVWTSFHFEERRRAAWRSSDIVRRVSVSVLSSVPSCVCLTTVSQCRPVSVSVLSLSAVLCLSQCRPVSVSVLSLSAVLCLSQCRPVSVLVLSLSAVLCLSQCRPVSVSVLSSVPSGFVHYEWPQSSL